MLCQEACRLRAREMGAERRQQNYRRTAMVFSEDGPSRPPSGGLCRRTAMTLRPIIVLGLVLIVAPANAQGRGGMGGMGARGYGMGSQGGGMPHMGGGPPMGGGMAPHGGPPSGGMGGHGYVYGSGGRGYYGN